MTPQPTICPVCEEGTLTASYFDDTFSHEGREVSVMSLEGSRCSNCAAEPIFPDQIRRNQLKISDAKRQAHGLLRGEQIRVTREMLGLSQQDAAAIFGGGTNGFSKYERGQTVQSVPMDRLLRVAGTYPWLVEFLRLLAGQEALPASSGSYVDIQDVSLNDPLYTSKPVTGEEVLVSAPRKECTVVPLWKNNKKKVA